MLFNADSLCSMHFDHRVVTGCAVHTAPSRTTISDPTPSSFCRTGVQQRLFSNRWETVLGKSIAH